MSFPIGSNRELYFYPTRCVYSLQQSIADYLLGKHLIQEFWLEYQSIFIHPQTEIWINI